MAVVLPRSGPEGEYSRAAVDSTKVCMDEAGLLHSVLYVAL